MLHSEKVIAVTIDIFRIFYYNRHLLYQFCNDVLVYHIEKGGISMKKIISVLFVSFLAIILISSSNQNNQTLDGDYYWINENRNERVFTISRNKGTIDSGEEDTFDIDQKNKKIELSGSQIVNRTESYTFKDGVFTVDISGTKHDYYLKGSDAYNKALKNIDTTRKDFL